MATITFNSTSEAAINGLIAGLEFCNDSSIAIAFCDASQVIIEDEDDDEDRVYTLDPETGDLTQE